MSRYEDVREAGVAEQVDRGNGGLWKTRKTIMLFSALSTNLGNRKNRFPHSHRHDYDEKDVRKSPGRSRLKLPASNPPFRLISGLEKTDEAFDDRNSVHGRKA
jgi:hypothetical protein